MRAAIEVADIFRAAGPAYRLAHAGHLSLDQLKVMSAIETCRTAALGGHVEACTDCGHQRIAYNSCRNRHCPRCQGAAARTWLEQREADLLPVGFCGCRPVCKRALIECARDRVQSSVRPSHAAFSEAAASMVICGSVPNLLPELYCS